MTSLIISIGLVLILILVSVILIVTEKESIAGYLLMISLLLLIPILLSVIDIKVYSDKYKKFKLDYPVYEKILLEETKIDRDIIDKVSEINKTLDYLIERSNPMRAARILNTNEIVKSMKPLDIVIRPTERDTLSYEFEDRR
jgi:hypothetical protein